MSGLQDAAAFYFHILTTMHGQNHIKSVNTRIEILPQDLTNLVSPLPLCLQQNCLHYFC